MASNECAQYAMAAISHNAAILRVCSITRFRIRGNSEECAMVSHIEDRNLKSLPIVKVYAIAMVRDSFKILVAAHLPKIPQPKCLIFPV